jgi:general secretion pathway protein F
MFDSKHLLRSKMALAGLWPVMAKEASFVTADYVLLSRQLKTLLQAGMTVVEAVETLASTRQGLEASRLSQALYAQLQLGLTFSAALESTQQAPAVLVAAVRAGERTSNLVEALDDYLRFDTMVSTLRSKVISASVYPALVTVLGLGISLFLLIVVMPNFSRMYTSLRGEAGGFTNGVIQLSRWLSIYQTEVILTVLIVGAFGLLKLTQRNAWADLMQGLERWPWVKSKANDFRLAMMYQALALLLKGGYPIVTALTVAAQSSLSRELNAGLEQAKERIARGSPIAPVLYEAGLCDDISKRLLAAAERNGDFYRAAEAVAHVHSERFTIFVERLTRIVEPVLLLAVALLVGTIVVMMYLPIFEIATQLR